MAPIAPLVVLAATIAQTPSAESGDALILESIVTSTAVSRIDVAEVEGYLSDRIHEAWGVEVSNTPPIIEGGRHFSVTLEWRSPNEVVVRVAEGAVVHVDRPVEIADPSSGQAILWLAIRSSIERALAAMPPAPPVAELLERSREDEPPAPPKPPAPPAPTRVTPADDGDPIDPRLYARFASLWSRKTAPRAGAWSTTVLARGGYDGGAAFGPAAQIRYALGRWLTVGGEIGYYDVEVDPALKIAHVPLTAFAGTQPDLEIPLELGVRATLDTQIVRGDQTAAGVRLLAGPSARSALPFYVSGGAQASFIAELQLDFAVVRGAYQMNGARYVDPAVAMRAGIGVEYRWR